jgi:hypothetical protein
MPSSRPNLARLGVAAVTGFITASALLLDGPPIGRAAQSGEAPAVQPAKRALLIGISQYARTGSSDEWWNLAASADVDAIRSVLLDKFGFTPADITTLTTLTETTRARILAAFERLIENTHKGDVIYVHYSGHGSSVRDTDGDEVDGLDEALVPSDYVSRSDGSRNITDDTINTLLSRLSARAPATVMLTFDNCFSGTQTRSGRMVVRGGGLFNTSKSGDGPHETSGVLDGRKYATGYVTISAARADQLATETDDDRGGVMGLLTYALVRQMRAIGPATTYRDLFDGVVDFVGRRHPMQVPQFEGDLDTVVMSGIAAPAVPYFETRMENSDVVIQAGALHGVTEGSRFALYPRETRRFDSSELLARGEASPVRSTTAVLRLEAPPDLERLRGARALQIAHNAGSGRTVIGLDVTDVGRLPRGDELVSRLERFAQDRGLVRLTRGGNAWHLKFCPTPCPLRAQYDAVDNTAVGLLLRQDGSPAAVLRRGDDLSEILTRAVEREARWQLIANLDHYDPQIQVEVRPVPVSVTLNAQGLVERASRRPALRTAGAQLRMPIGDHFMVEVRNTGTIDAYVTVFELSSDGALTPLWPHPRVGSSVHENRLVGAVSPARAEWVLLPLPYVFRVGPPAGPEIIKAIATSTPTDFSHLLSDNAPTRGSDTTLKTPAGRLLARVGGPLRAATDASDAFDSTVWSVGSFSFLATEK